MDVTYEGLMAGALFSLEHRDLALRHLRLSQSASVRLIGLTGLILYSYSAVGKGKSE